LTLHINYDHQCPKCEAYYVPYDDVPCPRCGLVEKERFDCITRAARSLLFNLDNYGSYVPPAWWVSSLGDHILQILFGIFEKFKKSEEKDIIKFSEDCLPEADWTGQKYLESHISRIASRVNQEIDKMSRLSANQNQSDN